VQGLGEKGLRLREGAAGAVKFALYEFAGEAGEPARQENEP